MAIDFSLCRDLAFTYLHEILNVGENLAGNYWLQQCEELELRTATIYHLRRFMEDRGYQLPSIKACEYVEEFFSLYGSPNNAL